MDNQDGKPNNNYVTPLLTDLYQLTMAYAYFKNKKHESIGVFELFFRKNPFHCEYTIFAGLEEALRFISTFKFTKTQSDFVVKTLESHLGESIDPAFVVWLETITTKDVKVRAVREGTVVFPRVPLLRVEGPIAVCQLLETPLLNLINYPSLVATNAARHRVAAGPDKLLVEFGCRRAQGPDGAMSASRYSCMGGFNGTSNVQAGLYYALQLSGTHAHSYVTSFVNDEKLVDPSIKRADGSMCENFAKVVFQVRKELGYTQTNDGELLAFIAYARAFPKSVVLLVDTYDTLNSGIPNFLCVAVALERIGHQAKGIRLDSGDLAYLSTKAREMFVELGTKLNIPYFKKFVIVASNDLNVDTIESLKQQGHEIDVFGVGTHLVTCQQQPALGCVYKLVQIGENERIKLSQEIDKVTLPGRKHVYRLFSGSVHPILDVMIPANANPPKVGERLLCRHPFSEHKRAYVTPTNVVQLDQLYFDGVLTHENFPTLQETQCYVATQVREIRTDHLRILNPTPYKVSVTEDLYRLLHQLWANEMPVPELTG